MTNFDKKQTFYPQRHFFLWVKWIKNQEISFTNLRSHFLFSIIAYQFGFG